MKIWAERQSLADRTLPFRDRSPYTVRRWFARGDRYRRPTPSDLRHLALVDLLWERWDDLPDDLKRRLRCTDG